MTEVERMTQIATVVDTLPDAWAFVMTHIDDVGPTPSVQVTPHWWDSDDLEPRTRFEVSVSGRTTDDEGDKR